jgi:hypothetical protein
MTLLFADDTAADLRSATSPASFGPRTTAGNKAQLAQ